MTDIDVLARMLSRSHSGSSKVTVGEARTGSGTLDLPDLIPAGVPQRERWLYKNTVALKMVRDGIDDARQGRVQDLGSFAQHATDAE